MKDDRICLMQNALGMAAFKDHVKTVQILLQTGKVDVNQQDHYVSIFFTIYTYSFNMGMFVIFIFALFLCVYLTHAYCCDTG